MVKHWLIDANLLPQRLELCEYAWEDCGLVMNYLDYRGGHIIQINFFIDVEGLRIISLPNTIESDDRIGVLMEASGIGKGPIMPAFIQDTSKFIDEVKRMHGYDAVHLNYLQYTMVTDDLWIEVVSSQPPTVTITPDKDSK